MTPQVFMFYVGGYHWFSIQSDEFVETLRMDMIKVLGVFENDPTKTCITLENGNVGYWPIPYAEVLRVMQNNSV